MRVMIGKCRYKSWQHLAIHWEDSGRTSARTQVTILENGMSALRLLLIINDSEFLAAVTIGGLTKAPLLVVLCLRC
jgi:hypothetical protein